MEPTKMPNLRNPKRYLYNDPKNPLSFFKFSNDPCFETNTLQKQSNCKAKLEDFASKNSKNNIYVLPSIVNHLAGQYPDQVNISFVNQPKLSKTKARKQNSKNNICALPSKVDNLTRQFPKQVKTQRISLVNKPLLSKTQDRKQYSRVGRRNSCRSNKSVKSCGSGSIHSDSTCVVLSDDSCCASTKSKIITHSLAEIEKVIQALEVNKNAQIKPLTPRGRPYKDIKFNANDVRSRSCISKRVEPKVYVPIDLTNDITNTKRVDPPKVYAPIDLTCPSPELSADASPKNIIKDDANSHPVCAHFDHTVGPYKINTTVDLTVSDQSNSVRSEQTTKHSAKNFDSGIAKARSNNLKSAKKSSAKIPKHLSSTSCPSLDRLKHLLHRIIDQATTSNCTIMYQPDQNRPESSQGMHFHVHQCVCTSPLYNPYRQPPMIAPYVPSAVPRPYNLSHYQYTQYNMPYNVPLFNANAIAHQVPAPTPAGHLIPESTARERRADVRDSADTVQPRTPEDLEDFSVVANDASTENFTKFLEQGCIRAEKIAIRNQHRPCFKNIQNLCNRTKNEILKPSHTVSNIHSQGIPWATKDFIYAYVRLINCWHMLKGYLQAKDGTLGNIDRELTGDFKTCYAIWESNTKDLAEHMIRIFSNLDNNVSNPIPNRQRIASTASPCAPIDLSITMDAPVKSVQQPIDEFNALSESTTEPSPREEESDGASRVYMKPGSYNVPKKNNSSDNSSPSIEFFETAKNIGAHYKKLEAKKQTEANNADKDWKNAIIATPNLLKKNSNIDEAARVEEQPTVATVADVENVRRWLYHDHFDQQNLLYPLSDMRILLPEASHVKVLQRPEQKEEPIKINVPDKTTEIKKKICCRKYNMDLPKKYIVRESEGLRLLLEELEKTELNRTLVNEMNIIQDCPDSLQTVINKHRCLLYKSPHSMVQDLRRIIQNAETFFSTDPNVQRQVIDFRLSLEDNLERLFPDINFSDVSDMDDIDKK